MRMVLSSEQVARWVDEGEKLRSLMPERWPVRVCM